jgi:DHA1 family tetracycline resistance protein-like MFS transporter
VPAPGGPGGASPLGLHPAEPGGPAGPQGAGRAIRPLYAAGFTTAFGAHAVAANLGVYTGTRHGSLLTLGILLALYDGAEVVLKPVFGALADRVGGRPVLIGGLLAFAAASGGFLLASNPAALFAARLGQGTAAAAFSPAASMLVARFASGGRGRAFGSYGAFKGLGYTLGPLLGSALVTLHGYGLLFAVLAALGVGVAGWAMLAVPAAPPLPRHRQTIADLTRRLSAPTFLGPTAALAGATAALSAGVGFLPVLGHDAGLGPVATGAAVSLLAATAAVIQPRAGHACDTGRLPVRTGLGAGLAAGAAGLALAAFVPGLPGLLGAATLIGLGTALITPLGFAALAATTPEGRLGQTMGAAEVGRELGDAGGPLLVGVIAAATLTGGLAALAALLAIAAGITAGARRGSLKSRSVP